MAQLHTPVLLGPAVDGLAPRDGGVYVDGNLGGGGHCSEILRRSAPTGRVIAFDLDGAAIEDARRRLAPFGERVILRHQNCTGLPAVLDELAITQVDGILLDLGLSSQQLESSGRGFSFLRDESLDMRMDVRQEQSAGQLVNQASAEDLADILYYYGEERQARRITAAIVAARRKAVIRTTGQLVAIIENAVPRRYHPRKIHVATRTFQALRIAVNRELDSLATVLAVGAARLRPGGRFCVISFHSLEDRLVKKAFRDNQLLRVATGKPIFPDRTECMENPRARSAKLRIAARAENHGI